MTTSDATLAPAPTEKNNGGKRRTRARKNKIDETDDVARPSARRARNGSKYSLDDLALALHALEAGDFQTRLPENGEPVMLEIARTFNRLTAQNQQVCNEVRRIGRTVGREDKMNDRAQATQLEGQWAQMIDAVNALITDLVQPTTEIARVLTAVAEGDLSQKMVLEIDGKSVQGEFLRIGTTVNRMVDQLSSFASEVTRVAREVGTEGKLGGQAQVQGVAGTWKDLTDNVNAMAGNLRARTTELARATSELESLNRELNRRTQDLQRALSARSRFYASMSHELRTPINAILGYSLLLLDNVYGPLNESQVKGIERTHRAARHLLELVNDVLDLSKIEAGKIELQLEPVSFPGLIEDLFVTVRPMAHEHGSPLSLEHLGELLTVVSDPRRVRQILLNLLSNAIKFGRGQPIRVVSQKWGDRGIEVQVIDQGVGIAAEDREKIFDEFVQLARDRHDGTGLGLPISQRLAVILNGSLTVQSEVGVGSTFYLRLPRMADALASEPLEQRPAETAA